jgi:hypothetical protein
MNARVLRPVDLVPPNGMTWGQVESAIQQHYGCEPHEREDMRRASLGDPDGWKVTTLLLYEEITQGRAGPSAAA